MRGDVERQETMRFIGQQEQNFMDKYFIRPMLPPHIAEHSPRDLESGCADNVLALARRMFGIRAECERRCV
jgi:hypothetical protein